MSALLISIFLYPAAAFAAEGDCEPSNGVYNTPENMKYRINQASFSSILGLNAYDARSSVVYGATAWNEQANSKYFTYDGDTTVDADDFEADCASYDFSLVVAVDEESGSSARTTPFCSGTKVLIRYYAKDIGGAAKSWAMGDVTTGQKDVAGLAVHEFGHTLGIGHPEELTPDNDDVYAAMRGSPGGGAQILRRGLYQWDLKCALEYGGERSTTGYRRYHASGTLGTESSFTTGDISKLSAGATWAFGSTHWAYSFRRDDPCLAWSKDFDTAETHCTGAAGNPIKVTESTWRDYSITYDRILRVSYFEYPTQWDKDSKHRIRYRRSNDGFDTVDINGSMSYCNSMDAWLACTSKSELWSGKPIAVAWNDAVNRTVFAWARQNRVYGSNVSGYNETNRVYVSVGVVSNTTLPEPTDMGVQSSIPPALACKDGEAGGYDCLLAYVPQSDPTSVVKVMRFWAAAGSKSYTLTIDSSEYTVSTSSTGWTAARVALWFNDDKFWLALRPNRHSATYKQDITLWSSSTGSSWSLASSSLGDSAIGPSAIPFLTGANNALTYTR